MSRIAITKAAITPTQICPVMKAKRMPAKAANSVQPSMEMLNTPALATNTPPMVMSRYGAAFSTVMFRRFRNSER